ncbi:MAG: fluoride efflux transporter FluC [Arthrobacter sp.]|uniref:fluoride efflux transporter FluC n=1 Tax=unclassified Arthrobacter TaxID=235627 RepID=UPI0026525F8F|nr:CrcB family protein [Micrococcaceae bacterium]MDN5813029.1 CrcB family protein [Micrococcaceae bacterium]MDN5823482.1 CrcB family protein [Micrococcaceae bacterium]MDN5879272.1 CrcB family protein [Micrococcaceae bacterium]MDN5887293.1 CrcB family protein [Micrococcaceae bacterium]
MTPLLFIALSLAGGLGAGTRLLVDGFIKFRTPAAFPVGTLLINVSGSLVLGLLLGLSLSFIVPEPAYLVAGTGFLGGYTTFSTASFESVRLLQERRYLASLANGLGMAVLCVTAAGGGFWLGSLA